MDRGTWWTPVHGVARVRRDSASKQQSGAKQRLVEGGFISDCGSGAQASDAARCTARSEVTCTLEDVFAAAARLLRWGGRFCLVFRTERLAELMETARKHKLEPKRLRLVQNTPQSAPSLLLLECRRGGKTGLNVEAPFLMTNADGSPSSELDAVYFRDKR